MKPRLPKSMDELRVFLEGCLQRDESFNVGLSLDVNRYGSRISRGESFHLSWYRAGGVKGQHFHAHTIEQLLREFLEWRAIVDCPPKPSPPAKAHITERPIRRLELKPAVSMWGEDPAL